MTHSGLPPTWSVQIVANTSDRIMCVTRVATITIEK